MNQSKINMCVVSFVGDQFNRQFDQSPWIIPQPHIDPSLQKNPYKLDPGITRQEFDQLKREVELMKKMLEGAKEYDRKNNEPNCEIEAKMAKLKAIAELVGVNLDDVLKKDA